MRRVVRSDSLRRNKLNARLLGEERVDVGFEEH
jgi:hypothetical protein